MKNKSVLASLALCLATLPCAALAMPITYDFTVNGGPDGPLAGVASSGFFSFDDSIVPAGGGILSAATLFTDFGFSWNGIAYDETTAESGALSFDASGALSGLLFGSNCTPGVCLIFPGLERWAVLSTAAFGHVFAYTLASTEIVYTVPFAATVTPRAVAVPEPSSLALFGLTALMMAALRRQRPRSA
jgi:hypothetical protein